jgi:hypothetical protein
MFDFLFWCVSSFRPGSAPFRTEPRTQVHGLHSHGALLPVKQSPTLAATNSGHTEHTISFGTSPYARCVTLVFSRSSRVRTHTGRGRGGVHRICCFVRFLERWRETCFHHTWIHTFASHHNAGGGRMTGRVVGRHRSNGVAHSWLRAEYHRGRYRESSNYLPKTPAFPWNPPEPCAWHGASYPDASSLTALGTGPLFMHLCTPSRAYHLGGDKRVFCVIAGHHDHFT